MLYRIEKFILGLNGTLLFTLFVLFFVGVINLYSASVFRGDEGLEQFSFYEKQLYWGIMGLVCLIAVLLVNYRHLESFAIPFFIVSIVLLCAVPLLGVSVYGAKRWLSFGIFNVQPSEIAKFSTLIMAAWLFSKHKAPLEWRELLGSCAICAVPSLLILRQPDLGTALNVMLIVAGIVLFRGVSRPVLKTCAVLIPSVLPLGWFVLHEYQKDRIRTFLNPESDPLGNGYHIIQSKIAIGSGEFWGKGFMDGTQSQLRFLPERHTDFAVAVFGEEWGFLGMMLLLTLYCVFLLSIVSTARDAKDRFGSFLCAGVFFYFFWQILINMGMVVGLMPVVGIPLPFISYGGSATIVNFCLVGLVLNISAHRYLFND